MHITTSTRRGRVTGSAALLLLTFMSVIPRSETINSTVCSGEKRLFCTDHELKCDSPAKIKITGAYYGFRPGCGSTTNCTNNRPNSTCCTELSTDCFLPNDNTFQTGIIKTCLKHSSCSFPAPPPKKSCNPTITEIAYNTVTYSCVLPAVVTAAATAPVTTAATAAATTAATTITTAASITTTKITTGPSTPLPKTIITEATPTSSGQEDDMACVPVIAVLTTFIVILIVLLVLGVLYFQRKFRNTTSQGESHELNHYASTHRRESDTAKPVYEDLQKVEGQYYNIDNVRRQTSGSVPLYCNLSSLDNSNPGPVHNT